MVDDFFNSSPVLTVLIVWIWSFRLLFSSSSLDTLSMSLLMTMEHLPSHSCVAVSVVELLLWQVGQFSLFRKSILKFVSLSSIEVISGV
jgi:hypothetical protein